MKKVFYPLFLLPLAISVSAQTWYYSPVFHGRDIYDVFVHSRSKIVCGGGTSTSGGDSLQSMFISNAGGMVWNMANEGNGGHPRSIDFIDELSGLAVGFAGKILKTTDGGGSWTRIHPQGILTQRNFTTVVYKDAQTVYAFGGRDYQNDNAQTIMRSNDGGNTWSIIHDAVGERWLKGACFINNSTAFAVGGEGTVMRTFDGGDNWSLVSSPVTDREFNVVYFINATTGFIAGGSFAELDTVASHRTLLKTTDGGNTWNIVMNEAGGWLTAIDFIDENTGYITGDGGQLYKTTDGGNNWTRINIPVSNWYSHLTCVKFLNENFGIVGGMYGEMFLFSNEPLPEVFTHEASVQQLTDTSARVLLRANINTHNIPVIYNFLYSTTPDFSSDVGIAYFPFHPVSFNSPSLYPVEAIIWNMQPSTTYYYFAYATAPGGTVYGDTLSFTTDVPYRYLTTHVPVSNESYTVFSGSIEQPSETLNVYYDYGLTPFLGNTIQATPFTVGGSQNFYFTDTIYSLLTDTVYFCRLKAVSQTDTFYGNTVAFYSGTLYDNFEVTAATDVTVNSATLNALISGLKIPIWDMLFECGYVINQITNWIRAVPSSINDTLTHQISATISNLQENTFYYFRLSGETSIGRLYTNMLSFYTGELNFTFNALPATTVGETHATLHAFVDNFPLPAALSFEYGTNQNFGMEIVPTPSEINDNQSYDISAFVNNLLPSTQYFFRLVAHTPNGDFYSNTQSFYTNLNDSYFTALPATEVTETSARLNAIVQNLDFPLSLSFEYGLTENFGNTINANPGNINDTLQHFISADLSGLQPNSLYYFRLKASSTNQTFYTTTRQLYTGEPEIPNWNFSDWQSDTMLLPLSWNTLCDSCFERVSGYMGGYAMKIFKFNVAIHGYFTDGEDGGGPPLTGGCPFNSRPDSAYFYANYFIHPQDSGMFIVHLYSGSTIISSGFKFITGSSNGNFVRMAFALDYDSPLMPDSMIIGFASFNPFSSMINEIDHSNNFIIFDNIGFTPAVSNSCHLNMDNWFNFPYDKLKKWYYHRSLFVDENDIQSSYRVLKTQGIEPDGSALGLRNINRIGRWIPVDISTVPSKDLFAGDHKGTPVSHRYRHFNGYYKAELAPGDTAVIEAMMNKNGEYAGHAMFYITESTQDFAPFDIVFQYHDTEIIPDSVVINARTKDGGEPNGYSFIAFDRLGFDGFWKITDSIPVSIVKHNEIDEVRIFPNPVKNNFTIELISVSQENIRAEVTDINGRIISQFSFQNRAIVDVSEFNSGIYFVRLFNAEKFFAKKIVVTK